MELVFVPKHQQTFISTFETNTVWLDDILFNSFFQAGMDCDKALFDQVVSTCSAYSQKDQCTNLDSINASHFDCALLMVQLTYPEMTIEHL